MTGGRHRPALTEVDLLELAPVRCAPWCERDGRVVITRPRARVRAIADVLALLAGLMRPRDLRLDETGSFVWRRLDGQQTVADVASALQVSTGDDPKALEQRLGLFVRTLRTEGLVAYPGWDPLPEE